MKRHILMKRSFAAIMSAAMLTAGLSGCTNSKQPESTGTKRHPMKRKQVEEHRTQMRTVFGG